MAPVLLKTHWVRRPASRTVPVSKKQPPTLMTIRYMSTKCLRAALLGVALFLTTSATRLLADDPKPDPAGTATGMAGDAQAAAGVSTFVVSAPSDMSADDKKDPAKVKAYNDAKKASDDFTSQSAKEPLAVRLADAVGHNRVAINFTWTLVTGFLVMFMQAGFA